jgi:hypothetical protein
LPEAEQLRSKPRPYGADEEPGYSSTDMRQLMETFADYVRTVNIPTVFSQKLLAAGLPEDFDPEGYLILHQDLAAAKVNAAEHYVKYGRREGRAYRRR